MGLGGSKMLDDRRRRRLVLETELDSSVAARLREDASGSAVHEASPPDLWLFLPQVVPQQLWKCWAAGVAAALGFLGLLTAWLFAEQALTAGSVLEIWSHHSPTDYCEAAERSCGGSRLR